MIGIQQRLNAMPTRTWTLFFIVVQILGALSGILIGRASGFTFERVYGTGAICWILAVLVVSLPRVLDDSE